MSIIDAESSGSTSLPKPRRMVDVV
jgi:hypothetical protein